MEHDRPVDIDLEDMPDVARQRLETDHEALVRVFETAYQHTNMDAAASIDFALGLKEKGENPVDLHTSEIIGLAQVHEMDLDVPDVAVTKKRRRKSRRPDLVTLVVAALLNRRKYRKRRRYRRY